MPLQNQRRRTLVYALSIGALLWGGTGCSRPPTDQAAGPVHVLESTDPDDGQSEPATPDPDCSRSTALAELAGYDDGLAMLDRSVEIARDHDERCGPPDDFDRQCRSVYLLGSTQPSVEWANGGDWNASLRVWQFAVDDGAESSSPDFVLMWAQLAEFTDGLAPILAADDQAALATRLVARGDVVDDLTTLEDICLGAK